MTTPSDLKAALVEAMATILDPEAFDELNIAEPARMSAMLARDIARETATKQLASLPPVLERFGCKVLPREPSDAMCDAPARIPVSIPSDGFKPAHTYNSTFDAYEANAVWPAMHDAAPTVPWEG
ncbi:MAG TPA: hypothetical protein VEA41_04665 [Salinarimonas sp.]|nr:hypothetical protein [Salinarimonas sp.]